MGKIKQSHGNFKQTCTQQWILWVENIMSSAIGQHNYVPWSHCVRMCRNVSSRPCYVARRRYDFQVCEWRRPSSNDQKLLNMYSGWEFMQKSWWWGDFFFFESYINLTAFLSSQNSCLPLHFWGSTLDAPDETFEASSFYFIGWLIEWQTSKTRVETVDFQHLHMNWWVLFISNSHVMPTDLWWTCDVSHQELNGKSGVCRLEPQRLDVYT